MFVGCRVTKFLNYEYLLYRKIIIDSLNKEYSVIIKSNLNINGIRGHKNYEYLCQSNLPSCIISCNINTLTINKNG